MSCVCIIPARGGSKRIRNKNIRSFSGRPIIEWSIEAALEADLFARVVVSTDSEEIAKVARGVGAEVPFFRPAELSDDYTGTIPVVKHGIEELEKTGEAISSVCCLYATAPFVTAERLAEAKGMLDDDPETQFVFPVSSFPSPIFRGVELDPEGRVSMIWPEKEQVRSQDLPDVYHDSGQFYWGLRDAFVSQLSVFSPHSKGMVIPRKEVQDIDTEEDWLSAEALFNVLKLNEAK
ncbi:MAG: pseudaminic acid cytidylyltransferase [Verrucomicrobiales bacterium]|nr:pseudaminic acid cytidylyltransferase [Verrucomicrobiales bacterium]